MLLVTLAGGMLALTWRQALMSARHMTFPTGDATGSLMAALHRPAGSCHGRKQQRKVRAGSCLTPCLMARVPPKS
jgi:hypothetical protein